MARRQYKRLTTAEVKKLATRPGRHPDGDGLYLKVDESGVASWVWRYLAGDRERFMGLGALRHTSLSEARRLADKARQLRRDGVDPIEARRAQKLDRRLKTAKAMSFKDCARAYIAAHSPTWGNALHKKQWPTTLETYVYPFFGDLPVAAIDTGLVLQALEPIWTTKTETASRVRSRIESVLDWAVTREYRPEGANPARWKGHLANVLPKPTATKKAARKEAGRDEHHAAMPYAEIGAFMVELRQQSGVTARALEFLILTAGRTGEVIEAPWSEIKRAEKLWEIPAERMKADKDHSVPLTDAAMAVLDKMAEIRDGDFVFPGQATGKPLSNMAMLQLLRRMGHGDLTVHGFRSSFRDWAAEQTSFPSEVCEMALAHTAGDKVKAAYQRSDLRDKRRQLAEAWAKFCDTLPVPEEQRRQVVNIGGRRQQAQDVAGASSATTK